MKTVKLFIGSSITDLKLERYKLMSFILGLNNIYHDRGVFFECYICEETPTYMRIGGSQEKHNDYIRSDADAAFFMFFRKAGEFTVKELELARRAFSQRGRPEVYIFFRDPGSEPEEEIREMMRSALEDFGRYYRTFDAMDTVYLEMLFTLAELMPESPEISVRDGSFFLNGERIPGISADRIPAFRGTSCPARQQDTEGTDGGVRGRGSLILEEARYFHDLNKTGEPVDPVKLEALRHFERGDTSPAAALRKREGTAS